METKKEIESKDPKQIKMLFWSVFAGSKGCINRVKIVLKLKHTPLNTNQHHQQALSKEKYFPLLIIKHSIPDKAC